MMSGTFLRICVTAAVVSLPLTISANRTYYETISLEELIRRSALILVVEKREPFQTTEEVPIRCPGGTTARPFVRLTHHYAVREVLLARGFPAGDSIAVRMANDASALEIQQEYECAHVSKSPIYDAYRFREERTQAGKSIIFITPDSRTTWAYTTLGAFEPVSEAPRIRKLIAALQKSDGHEDP